MEAVICAHMLVNTELLATWRALVATEKVLLWLPNRSEVKPEGPVANPLGRIEPSFPKINDKTLMIFDEIHGAGSYVYVKQGHYKH